MSAPDQVVFQAPAVCREPSAFSFSVIIAAITRCFLELVLTESRETPQQVGAGRSRRICWVYISCGESRRAWHTECPLSHHISLFPSAPLTTPPQHTHLHTHTMPQCYLCLFLGVPFSLSRQVLFFLLSAAVALPPILLRFADFTPLLSLVLPAITCSTSSLYPLSEPSPPARSGVNRGSG